MRRGRAFARVDARLKERAGHGPRSDLWWFVRSRAIVRGGIVACCGVLVAACSSSGSQAVRPSSPPTSPPAQTAPALIDPGAADSPPGSHTNGSINDHGLGADRQLTIASILLCTAGTQRSSEIVGVQPSAGTNLIVKVIGTRPNPSLADPQAQLVVSTTDALTKLGFNTHAPWTVPPCANNYLQLPSLSRGTVNLGLTVQIRGQGRAVTPGFRIAYRLGTGTVRYMTVILPIDLCRSGDPAC
jgi:hypothetical protein